MAIKSLFTNTTHGKNNTTQVVYLLLKCISIDEYTYAQVDHDQYLWMEL